MCNELGAYVKINFAYHRNSRKSDEHSGRHLGSQKRKTHPDGQMFPLTLDISFGVGQNGFWEVHLAWLTREGLRRMGQTQHQSWTVEF